VKPQPHQRNLPRRILAQTALAVLAALVGVVADSAAAQST
jgi:hypothetical protein